MIWLALVLSAANPHLEPAQQLVKELKYSEAAQMLAKARAFPGNDRATLTEVLWLQGQVAATLGKADDARTFFRLLCSIEPDYAVKGEPPPKVMSPFFEAKGWASTMGRLKFEALPPEVKDGKITAVATTLAADPLKLARSVRFHLKGTTASWYVVDAKVTEARAGIAWAATELSWWADLIGENDAVVAQVGSEAAPLEVKTKSELAAPPPPVVVAPKPAPSRGFFSPMRVAGLGALIAGVGLGVAGAAMASSAATEGNKIKTATRDASGTITSLSQREAFAIDGRAQFGSTAATGLFVGAGVFGAGGVVLFVFGGP